MNNQDNLEEARILHLMAADLIRQSVANFESGKLEVAERLASGAREIIRRRDVALLCHSIINKVVFGAP